MLSSCNTFKSDGPSTGEPIETTNPYYDENGLLKQFSTPAYINDVSNLPGEAQQAFFDAWSDYISGWTDNSSRVNLNPQYTNTIPGDYYFNPMYKAMNNPNPPTVVPVRWNASPYRIRFYYQSKLQSLFTGKITINSVEYPASDYALWQLTDMGPDAYGKINKRFDQNVLPGDSLCSNDKKYFSSSFDPLGPRGWLDEYCEFAVKRSETPISGTIKEKEIDWAIFTCENPEYYWTLWSISPESVLKIYQETLDNSNIQLSDLYLLDSNNQPVPLPTGGYAYNPINKFNNGTVITNNSGGAVHLTSPPNELSAEIVLAGGACVPRKSNDGWNTHIANDLICCSNYGRRFRNSDPHIGQSVYQAVSQMKIAGTLLNPVGLYLQLPNFDLFELPESVINMGGKPEDLWTVLRGETENPYYPNQMVLRAKFQVPSSWGINTSDIKIAGAPLVYASQIAQTMEVQLAAASHVMRLKAPSQACTEGRAHSLPFIDLVTFPNLYKASIYNGLKTKSNFSSNPIAIRNGQTVDSVQIMVQNLGCACNSSSASFTFYDTKTGEEAENMSYTPTSCNTTIHPPPPGGIPDTTYTFIGSLSDSGTTTPVGNKSIQVTCNSSSNSTMKTPGYFRILTTY